MIEIQSHQNPTRLFKAGHAWDASKPDFLLPDSLQAAEPPEARGLKRDQVRLLVSHYITDRFIHAQFREIGRFFRAGDVLVINTSGTMSAAIAARRADGLRLEVHLSTRFPAELWSVEIRRPSGSTTQPFHDIAPGERLHLSGGGSLTLLTPYDPAQRTAGARARLWLATLSLPAVVDDYLAEHGVPIRYSYVKDSWPISYYQTVYATETGSAEMPSAGRAFTPEVITQLVAKGVQIAPLILHTGVSSLESHEPPYDEFYRVPPITAEMVNTARSKGRRVLAVGTTCVRALETVTDKTGKTISGEGWTGLVITRDRSIRSIDGLLTGFHEPRATHLAMLESLVGLSHLNAAYQQALEQKYLWHEFGDLHLILP